MREVRPRIVGSHGRINGISGFSTVFEGYDGFLEG